jgi:nicotinamidase-related amidase
MRNFSPESDPTNDARLDPRLIPARTGVVLCDLQNDVCRGSGPFYNELALQVRERRVIENAVRVVDGARKAGATIFFITVVRRPDYGDVVNQLTEFVATGKAVPSKQQISLVQGTRGAELVEELRPQQSDYVLVKKRRSAFHATALDLYLRARDINTLIVGGVATDIGLENTVRAAWDLDYNQIVVSDICAAYPAAAHDYTMGSVFPRMARIMSTDQVLVALGAGPR